MTYGFRLINIILFYAADSTKISPKIDEPRTGITSVIESSTENIVIGGSSGNSQRLGTLLMLSV